MRRTFRLGLGTLALALGLAACGRGDAPSPAAGPEEAAPATDAAPHGRRTVGGVPPAEIVLARSATQASGALPDPVPPPAGPSPAALLAGARERAAAPAPRPADDVRAFRTLVERTLRQAGLAPGDVAGGALPWEVKGTACRLLQVDVPHLGAGSAAARFVRLVGGPPEAVGPCFDARFAPWEAGGYHVRTAEGPGERAATTNLHDPGGHALLWQVGRVMVELRDAPPAVAARLDAAARDTGLYAGAAPDPDAEDLSALVRAGVESDADLPYEELHGDGRRPATPPDAPLGDSPFEDDPFGKEPSPDTASPEKPVGAPKEDGAGKAPASAASPQTFDGRVKGVRFFEGGPEAPAVDQRTYRVAFARAGTRYVWWELVLAFPPSSQPRTFEVQAVWTTSGGGAVGTQRASVQVEPGEVAARPCLGWGREEAGVWPPGLYRVDLQVGDTPLTSGVFRVQGPPSGTARLSSVRLEHNRVVDGEKGMVIVYDLVVDGRLGEETHVGVYPRFEDARPLRDFDGRYRTGDGDVATHVSLRPAHASAEWKQAEVFLPYAQLHLDAGKHALKIEVRVYDPPSNVTLARSAFLPFTVTRE